MTTPRTKGMDKLSRPPLERMLRIHEELKAGRAVNCSRLGRLLEVSSKTVMRDIEFMRDRLGLPIEYEPSEYRYSYTSPVDSFPTVQVSEGEVVALLVAQKAMEQYRGTPFESTLRSAFGKIVSGLSERISFQPGPEGGGISFKNAGASVADLKTFELLSRAIGDRKLVAFDYVKLQSEQAEPRKVEPLHLACVQGLWYLVAHDCSRQGLRTFALPRLSGVRLLEEGFEARAGFSAETYFANSFGVFAGEGSHCVRIRFDTFSAQLVRERFWHGSQSIRELKGGELELSLQLSDLTEIENWILGWGAHARVLQPKALASRIRATAEAMLRQYQT